MDSNKFSVPIAIVLAGALIAGSIYLSNKNVGKKITAPNIVPTASTTIRPVSSDDHILGNPNADLLIVEYSDTECPYCKQFHQTLIRLMNEYGKEGKVAWVYRHFPIESLHSKSMKEAEATECANELGGVQKFWEYIDAVYEKTNSNDSLNPAELPKIAKSVGLNVTDFNTCLSSGRHEAKVRADYDDAIKSGGQGTPHTILVAKDGSLTPLDGAYPYDQLKVIIDSALK